MPVRRFRSLAGSFDGSLVKAARRLGLS